MPTITKLYTMEEASQHNSTGDCWVVIDGKVYDVSTYLDEHPGGDDVIIAATDFCGMTWAGVFSMKGKMPQMILKMLGTANPQESKWKTFCIGELDPTSPAIPELEICSKKQPSEIAQKLKDLTKQYWAVPITVAGVSVIIGFLYLQRK